MKIKFYGDQEYFDWKKNPTPDKLAKVVNKFSGLLHKELPKYYGNLPPTVIKSYGKKFIINSLDSFNPQKGSLSSHVSSNLRKLHRVNYETSSIFRMSEELQRGVNQYKQSKETLSAKLKRDPTNEEMSDELHWSPTKVARIENQLMNEVMTGNLEFTPAHINMQDPVIDYIYHDLPAEEKIIFQHRTGYRGNPILKLNQLSKKLNISPATISNKAMRIAKKIKDASSL